MSLTPNVLAAVRWSTTNALDPTQMLVSETTSNIDMYVYDYDWNDNDLYAWFTCPTYALRSGGHPQMTCSGSELHINIDGSNTSQWAPGGNVNWNFLCNITTHELGHGVGLRHRSGDNEVMNAVIGLYGYFPWYSTHDVDHINASYLVTEGS